MTFVPPSGAVKAAAAQALKALERPEGSGYDDDFIDSFAEDYEYFVMPDHDPPPRKDVDRNLDKMLTGAHGLLDALMHSRDDGLTEAFHSIPLNHPLDRHRITLSEFQRWVERLIDVARKRRDEPGAIGRRRADRPTQIASKLAEHFCMLTRNEPTLSKKRGSDYCGCIARVFAVLRIEDAQVESYARKAISMRKLGNAAPN